LKDPELKALRNRAIRSFSILFVAMGAIAYALSKTQLNVESGQQGSTSENLQPGTLIVDFSQMDKEYREFQEFQAFKRFKEQQRLREQQQTEGDSSPKTPS
jgi:hypothetical protein